MFGLGGDCPDRRRLVSDRGEPLARRGKDDGLGPIGLLPMSTSVGQQVLTFAADARTLNANRCWHIGGSR